MQYMWADTLLGLERAHLLRLVLWGGTSVLVGSALLALLRVRGRRSSLLDHFGIQTALWGAIDVGFKPDRVLSSLDEILQ